MSRRASIIVAWCLVVAAAAIPYRHVLAKLAHDWAVNPDYSHGALIPPIALFLAWERRRQLRAAPARPATTGLLLVAASLAVLGVGTLGMDLFLTRISLIGLIAGTIAFLAGWRQVGILTFPLLFLVLMIPLPAIVFNEIAFPLQLLASRFGESVLNAAGVPVLREGNLITLASTTLAIDEACSGIRSLVSLLTLAILYGYFAERRGWARTALALASVPIAILANGVRVAGTGLTAQYLGLPAAQGFFHAFSGWVLFIVAFVLFLLVHRLLVWLGPRSPRSPAASPAPLAPATTGGADASESRSPGAGLGRAAVLAACLLLTATLLGRGPGHEPVPPREPLSSFPLRVGTWTGRTLERFDRQTMALLGVDDYVSRQYTDGSASVGFYVGYYASQRQGDTMHSPLNCLPGAGWEPVQKLRLRIPVASGVQPGAPVQVIEVNRILIQRGIDRQVVLYWYQSHGRVVASEYWGKIYTVLDAIRLNRSDAAMIRVSNALADGERASEAAADAAATSFVKAVFPLLGRHLPG